MSSTSGGNARTNILHDFDFVAVEPELRLAAVGSSFAERFAIGVASDEPWKIDKPDVVCIG